MPRSKQQLKAARAQSRNRIIESAAILFSLRGFHFTSMTEIAEHAKISKGLAYNYFESKEEILKTILDSITENRFKALEKVMDEIPDNTSASEKVSILIDRNLDYLISASEQHRLHLSLFLQPAASPVILNPKKTFEKQFRNFCRFQIEFFSQLGSPNPALEAAFFRSALQGVAVDYIMAPALYPMKEMREYLKKRFSSLHGQ